MNIIKENTVRKLDAQGRVIIPKGLRDRLQIAVGDEVDFYLITNNNNDYYIGIKKNNAVDPKFLTAAQVLKELGIKIPTELKEKIGEDE